MIKNRKDLIRFLVDQCGYKGPTDSLQSVKSFISDPENLIDLRDEKDRPVDIDRLWAKTVTITVAADAGEDVVVSDASQTEAEEMDEDEMEEESKSRKRSRSRVSRVNSGTETKGYHNGGLRKGTSVWAKANYARKIRDGRTVFSDADCAEAAGAWFRQVHAAAARAKGATFDYRHDALDREIVQKVGLTTINSGGGFLVPEDFRADLIYLAEQRGAARRLATVETMTRDRQTFPRNTSETAASHIGEGNGMTAADDTGDNVTLSAKLVGRLVKVSNSLLEDAAISVVDRYGAIFVNGFLKREDDDYILGDGGATYGGNVGLDNALPSGAYKTVATGTTFATLTIADIMSVIGIVECVNPGNIALCMSRQCYFQAFMRLAASAGGVTAGELTAGWGAFGGSADALWNGYPVIFCQSANTTGTTGQKIFYAGDFKAGSKLGDRRTLSVQTSEHRYFDEDNTAIRATARVAQNIHLDGGTAPNSIGPIVCGVLA